MYFCTLNTSTELSKITANSVSHQFWVNPFFSFPLSGVIRDWTPQYKDQDDGKIVWQNQLKRLQRVRFECPEHRNRCVSSIFGWIPFSYFPLFGNWTFRGNFSTCALQARKMICGVRATLNWRSVKGFHGEKSLFRTFLTITILDPTSDQCIFRQAIIPNII